MSCHKLMAEQNEEVVFSPERQKLEKQNGESLAALDIKDPSVIVVSVADSTIVCNNNNNLCSTSNIQNVSSAGASSFNFFENKQNSNITTLTHPMSTQIHDSSMCTRKRSREELRRKSVRIENLGKDNEQKIHITNTCEKFTQSVNLQLNDAVVDSELPQKKTILIKKEIVTCGNNIPVANQMQCPEFNKALQKFNTSLSKRDKSLTIISIGQVVEKLKLCHDEEVFEWILSNIKTKYTTLNDKFERQFLALRELGCIIEQLPLDTKNKWERTIWDTKYMTPVSTRGWSLIFGPQPPNICLSVLLPSLQNKSNSQKTRRSIASNIFGSTENISNSLLAHETNPSEPGCTRQLLLGSTPDPSHMERLPLGTPQTKPTDPRHMPSQLSETLPSGNDHMERLSVENSRDFCTKLSIKASNISKAKYAQKLKLSNCKLISKEKEVKNLQINILRKNVKIKKLKEKISVWKCKYAKKDGKFKLLLKIIGKINIEQFLPSEKDFLVSLLKLNSEKESYGRQQSYISLPVSSTLEETSTNVLETLSLKPISDEELINLSSSQSPEAIGEKLNYIDTSWDVGNNKKLTHCKEVNDCQSKPCVAGDESLIDSLRSTETSATADCKDGTLPLDEEKIPVVLHMKNIPNTDDLGEHMQETIFINEGKEKIVGISTNNTRELNQNFDSEVSENSKNLLAQFVSKTGDHNKFKSINISKDETYFHNSHPLSDESTGNIKKQNPCDNTNNCQNANTGEQDKENSMDITLENVKTGPTVADFENDGSLAAQNANQLSEEKVTSSGNVREESLTNGKIEEEEKDSYKLADKKNLVEHSKNQKTEFTQLYGLLCKNLYSTAETEIEGNEANIGRCIKLCQEKAVKLNSFIKNTEYKMNVYKREVKALQTDLVNNENVLKNELDKNEQLIEKYNDLKKRVSSQADKGVLAFSCQCKKEENCKKSVYIRLKTVSNTESGKCEQKECLLEIQNMEQKNEQLEKKLESSLNEVEKIKKDVASKEAELEKLDACITALKESNIEIKKQLALETELKTKCETEFQDCKTVVLESQKNNLELKLILDEKEQELLNNVNIFQSEIQKLNQVIKGLEDKLNVKSEKCVELEGDIFKLVCAITNLRTSLGIDSIKNDSQSISVCEELLLLSELQDEIQRLKQWYTSNFEDLQKKKRLIQYLAIQVKCIQKEKGKYLKGNKLLKKKLSVLKRNMVELQSEITGIKNDYIEMNSKVKCKVCGGFPQSHFSGSQISGCECSTNYEDSYMQEANERITNLARELADEKQINKENFTRIEELDRNCQELTDLLKQEHSESSRQLELQLAMYCATADRYKEQLNRIENGVGDL